MRITTTARIQNNAWRFDPDTGFLRCTASILCVGVMQYTRDDLAGADIPDGLGERIRMYVPPEELQNPDGIATLEGMPAVVGHVWQTAGNLTACGNVAGTPGIQGDHLMADILVTDPNAVRRVMLPEGNPERLQEISSAGDWSICWESGVTDTGEPYDGYFVKLRYNHVALLPAGAGRAGASVRIINEKEVAKVSDFTRMKVGGRVIRVLNEDVEKMEEALNEADSKVKNAVSAEELQAALDELAALKAEVGDKNARIAELEGTVQAFKDQLESAMSPEQVEAAADEMAQDREEATAVMNSAGLKLEGDDRKLRGHALRAKVVNSIRVKNGKSALTEDELKDEGYVKGMYKAQAELAGAVRKPTGANVVNVHNQQSDKPNMADPKARMERMYGGSK